MIKNIVGWSIVVIMWLALGFMIGASIALAL